MDRAAVCRQYLPMVQNLATSFSRTVPGKRLGTVEDCVQVGLLGLLHATDHYEPRPGVTFFTYAYACVLRRLFRASFDEGLIRIPNCYFGSKRLAPHVHQLVSRSLVPVPLGAWTHASPDNPVLNAARHETSERVHRALQALHPRYRQIIELRYLEDKTQEATGQLLGLKKQRVQQLETVGVAKLLKIARRQHLHWSDANN